MRRRTDAIMGRAEGRRLLRSSKPHPELARAFSWAGPIDVHSTKAFLLDFFDSVAAGGGIDAPQRILCLFVGRLQVM